MPEPLDRTALLQRLEQLREPTLYGSLLKLRDDVAQWLGYTPEAFPHYTRHTIEHSEEIVRQLSKLLFRDSEPDRPVIDLSAAEIYCLVAAAFLHDAGMVTSDRERREILDSAEWAAWTTDGGGTKRWAEIERLRGAATTPKDHYVADLQTRFLIAEWVRARHHVRSASLVRHSESFFSSLDLGDPALGRTVADICEAHGLDWGRLDDAERFPMRRDLPGGTVNVRLMAVLLRLGDLLDMSHDRACPMLLTAGAPVPNDSLAHWTQYQRIVHRLTSPDRVEITAECENQNEHRVLRDWCGWMEKEVNHAGTLLRGSPRHPAWQPPSIRLGGAEPTIKVRPAPSASYIPVDWTFELEPDTVFERLVRDAYTDPLDFLRELIQNAADANRCVLRQGSQEAFTNDRWPDPEATPGLGIRVEVGSEIRTNAMSGEDEERPYVIVEDDGIGMTADVIQRYLLQVGRSFYNSPDFKRRYGFVATSRFGVGFLSVFAVSDDVTVETYNPAVAKAEPLRVQLTGPQSYVLLERGTRPARGTTVKVMLSDRVEFDDVLAKVRGWCPRLEFPITIRDRETQMEAQVTHEQPTDFEFDVAVDAESLDRLRCRALSLDTATVRGEWYVLEGRDRETGQWRWDISHHQVAREVLARSPLAPPLPAGGRPLVCFHGLNVTPQEVTEGLTARLDMRKSQEELPLSLDRRSWWRHRFPPEDPDLERALFALVTKHFDDVQADWRYRARCLARLRLPDDVDFDVPGAVRVFDKSGECRVVTFAEVRDAERLWVFASSDDHQDLDGQEDLIRRLAPCPAVAADDLMVLASDVAVWDSRAAQIVLAERRKPTAMVWLDGVYAGCLEHDATTARTSHALYTARVAVLDPLDPPSDLLLASIGGQQMAGGVFTALNRTNPVVLWLAEHAGLEFEPGAVVEADRFNEQHGEIRRRFLSVLLSRNLDQDTALSRANDMLAAIAQQSTHEVLEVARVEWRGSYYAGTVVPADR